MRFLSSEWLQYRLQHSSDFVLAERLDLRIQHVVTDCPGTDEPVRYYDELADGRLCRSGLGDIEDPHFTLHNTCADELGVLRGDIDPYVAVVEGTVRVDGDTAQLLSFLPLLAHHQRELDDIAERLVGAVEATTG